MGVLEDDMGKAYTLPHQNVRILSWLTSIFSTLFKCEMRRFRSLLIDKADIKMPGLHVMTFAVHRHLDEHASVEPHHHSWSQAILYLGGRGRQSLAGRTARVEPGTLVVLPPGISHAFQRTDERTPLCVMIDFRLRGASRSAPVICSSDISLVRQQLAHLMKTPAGEGHALHWESAIIVLQILITLLRSAGWIERVSTAARTDKGSVIQGLLDKMDHASPLGHIVQRSGYQRDHLNRLVKKETGLTLGQFRAQQRLARAKKLLEEGMLVAGAATAVGLPDQNYFARWFRRQTGLTPSDWAKHQRKN
jgi:AraC family transcriptional regulator, transcriptional activator of pobA